MNSEEYKQLLNNCNVLPLSDIGPGVHDIYFVVSRSFDLKQSLKGDKDWKLTLYVADPTYEQKTSLSALLFNPTKDVLSKFKKGVVVVLKSVKVGVYQNKYQILANKQKKVALFGPNSDKILETNFQSCPFTKEELKIVKYLQSWSSNSFSDESEPQQQLVNPTRRSLLEVKDIVDNSHPYMDFVGRVVNVTKAEQCIEILLTDYTENPSPPSVGDRDELNIGDDYLIFCSLWENHIATCPSLTPGDYVFLRNCKKKHSRGILELNIHGNKEKKILINKLDASDSHLTSLLERQKIHSNANNNLRLKRRRVETFEVYPLQSIVMLSDPIKSTSIKEICKEKIAKTYTVKAYVKSFKPSTPRKWIRGWCSACNISTSPGIECSGCHQPTKFVFKFAFLINDGGDDDLMVLGFGYHANVLLAPLTAEEAFRNDTSFAKFEKMASLFCNDIKQYFDLALDAIPIQNRDTCKYIIANTQLILSNDN